MTFLLLRLKLGGIELLLLLTFELSVVYEIYLLGFKPVVSNVILLDTLLAIYTISVLTSYDYNC